MSGTWMVMAAVLMSSTSECVYKCLLFLCMQTFKLEGQVVYIKMKKNKQSNSNLNGLFSRVDTHCTK